MQTEVKLQPKPTTQDHKSFLASLSIEQRRDITQKSDWEGWKAFFFHVAALVLSSLWIFWALPMWQFALVLQGILLVFLFTAMHEATHRTVFQTQRINDLLAIWCGVLLLLPPLWFRYFHFAHHRYTQDPERDPELATPKPGSRLQYLWWLSGLPVWKSQVLTLFTNAFGRLDYDYVPTSKLPKVRFEARLMLAIYAIVIVPTVMSIGGENKIADVVLWLWLLPLFLGQPFLRLYLLAEHGRCPLVENMLENTRTTFTNKLVRRLAWNMPYHAEHHTMPTVPFYKLPDLHLLLRSKLKTTSKGYTSFNRTVWSSFTKEVRRPEEG